MQNLICISPQTCDSVMGESTKMLLEHQVGNQDCYYWQNKYSNQQFSL